MTNPSTEDRPSLSSLVGTLATRIERGLDPGDVAALRRLDPERPHATAFWWLLVGTIYPEESPPQRQLQRWARLLALMAQAAGLHRPDRSFGQALAEAGFSELRFERLLRANEENLWPYLRRAVGYLAAGGHAFDQVELARLVLTWDSERRERLLLSLAENYYRVQHKKQTA